MFSIIQTLFLHRISLYILTPDVYLGLEIKFGPQMIKNLAFVSPQSVRESISNALKSHSQLVKVVIEIE